jgi:23S rRNA pseudouridine2604 synthase
MEEYVRANKLLSEYGYCSRRKADRLIEDGKVTCDEKILIMGEKVLVGSILFVEGLEVKKVKERVILAFYKPRGIECTANVEVTNNVFDYMKYDKRLMYIGRLDKDSEGLLLLTNEGALINKIMRAGNFHEKEYDVEVHKEITNKFMDHMSKGVEILDTVTSPCFVEKIDANHFRIILTQGLNRQIRRMCEVFDYKVISLKRTRIMNVFLGDMKEGIYRELTKEEEQTLRTAIEGSYNTFNEGAKEEKNESTII